MRVLVSSGGGGGVGRGGQVHQGDVDDDQRDEEGQGRS